MCKSFTSRGVLDWLSPPMSHGPSGGEGANVSSQVNEGSVGSTGGSSVIGYIYSTEFFVCSVLDTGFSTPCVLWGKNKAFFPSLAKQSSAENGAAGHINFFKCIIIVSVVNESALYEFSCHGNANKVLIVFAMRINEGKLCGYLCIYGTFS